jgi:pyruvate kinase
MEGMVSSAVRAAIDMGACLMAIMSNSITPAMLLAKYRPAVPTILVTQNPSVSSRASLINGVFPYLVRIPGDRIGISICDVWSLNPNLKP